MHPLRLVDHTIYHSQESMDEILHHILLRHMAEVRHLHSIQNHFKNMRGLRVLLDHIEHVTYNYFHLLHYILRGCWLHTEYK